MLGRLRQAVAHEGADDRIAFRVILEHVPGGDLGDEYLVLGILLQTVHEVRHLFVFRRLEGREKDLVQTGIGCRRPFQKLLLPLGELVRGQSLPEVVVVYVQHDEGQHRGEVVIPLPVLRGDDLVPDPVQPLVR